MLTVCMIERWQWCQHILLGALIQILPAEPLRAYKLYMHVDKRYVPACMLLWLTETANISDYY